MNALHYGQRQEYDSLSMEVTKSLMSKQKIDSAYNGESNENSREDNDDSENMLSEDEDEQEQKEDLAFLGDDAEDSDSSKISTMIVTLQPTKTVRLDSNNSITKKRTNIDIPLISLSVLVAIGQLYYKSRFG
jgi:hypothetical protein